ncbi:hypothetical protein GCM10010499_51300 [Streptomyces thermoviolaceus subsp. apingens]|nr:hypothetical protein GCM10010499_51300 [Streptomyces thermoviolaceus subsp. apingens]
MRPGSAGESYDKSTAGLGHDLHVHAVAPVLVGAVGPAVAAPVAFGERDVEQEEIGIVVALCLQ